jgi:hypothetical protein
MVCCVAGYGVCVMVYASYYFGAFFALVHCLFNAGTRSACSAKQVYVKQSDIFVII